MASFDEFNKILDLFLHMNTEYSMKEYMWTRRLSLKDDLINDNG